jgi:hypothetical protein
MNQRNEDAGATETDEFDAVAAFAAKFNGEPEDAREDDEDDNDEPDAGADDTSDAYTDADEDEGEGEAEADPDDADVDVTVGEEARKVKLRDLKGLYAREQEITERHTAVTETIKKVEAEGEKAVAILSTLIQQADKAWEPYADVDLALAAQRLDERAYNQLKADMQAAHNQRVFLRQEADAYLSQVRANRSEAQKAALRECDTVLANDPLTKGWDTKARADVTAYAVSQGLPKDLAENLADPAAIKLIRKAMLFDTAKTTVQAKVKPAVEAAKKVLRAGSTDSESAKDAAKAALRRLRDSGREDDAAAAFAARFSRGR